MSPASEKSDNGSTTKEHRRYPRDYGPFEGRWHDTSGTHHAKIYHLNEGGCFVEARDSVLLGECVRLELHLPQAGWISASAEAIYLEPNAGFAVKFLDLTTDHQEAIRWTVENAPENDSRKA